MRHPDALIARRRPGLSWALLLALTLLLQQAWGLRHEVLHGPQALRAAASAAPAAGAAGADKAAFGHDAGSAECRLLAGLSLGDAVHSGVLGLPAAAPAPVDLPGVDVGDVDTPRRRAFDARGPPAHG